MAPEPAQVTGSGPHPLRLVGAGSVLPGQGRTCRTRHDLWDVLRSGQTQLSPFSHAALPLRIAGQVQDWDVTAETGVPERIARRMARVTALSMGAVQNALADAGLEPTDLNDDRSALIIASMQYAFQEAGRYFAAYNQGGPATLGMDYWLTGTPGSVASGICSLLGIHAQTLSITGGCNCSMRALEIATTMIEARTIDRAVVVGADATLDPIFLASTVHEGKRGFRASTLSSDPWAVRPHDEHQDGNAPGEGALAVVLESERARAPADGTGVRLWFRSSRNNGQNPVDSGTADNFVHDVRHLLDRSGVTLADLAFVNGFAEGTRNIEDLFCDVLTALRTSFGYDGNLLLSNQEAVFGHISGCAGLLKFLSSALMFRNGAITPVTGCRTPYSRLPASPVTGRGVPIVGRHALLISSGAGGDATSVLMEYHEGDR
ncbi:beta-ketoacyl synthase N-terminal-like domain-containing protein [Phytoactinopolyspora limicola]|uniref:beta-ketoacyl synthase N-terminal-like domain-containing protein n=1 Tax=Phytoactinopolyspora limicola TaxID=2715536 RepID=UPI001407D760|nr:beta-ketoacyl synthase N-terminal-like domain-containing protein [Phytoactinopolyspora limicola]